MAETQTPTSRPQSTRLAILIPFGIVSMIWGSTWLVIRDQLGVVPPSWSVSYRFLVAGVAMTLYALVKRERFVLTPSGIGFALAVGIPQFVLNFNFIYRAESFITSGLVAVIFALLLVPNAVMGRVFLGQRLGRQLIVGSIVALGGEALLFLHEVRVDPHGTGRVLAGIGFTLAGTLSASTANVLQATERARRYPLASTLAIAMLAGSAIDAGVAWWLTGPPVVEWRVGYTAGILYLGLAASALAFPLYFAVIRVIGPAKAAYSSVLTPLMAMILSTLFEGYRWSALAVGGSALAAVGLVMALRARRPAR